MKIRALLLVIVFGLIINYASADDTESKNYIIIKGDTLWDIANRYGVSIADIIRINNLKERGIQSGQVLKLEIE